MWANPGYTCTLNFLNRHFVGNFFRISNSKWTAHPVFHTPRSLLPTVGKVFKRPNICICIECATRTMCFEKQANDPGADERRRRAWKLLTSTLQMTDLDTGRKLNLRTKLVLQNWTWVLVNWTYTWELNWYFRTEIGLRNWTCVAETGTCTWELNLYFRNELVHTSELNLYFRNELVL